ncbi:MAG: trehalose-phosphatase [Ktedonobacteraceae bacterium]|nr:trehalose-phosphatase [Ktedonobacteraceae bacterium]
MVSTDIAALLARRPLGLVFDIDGTLSPIAETPGEAQLYPGIAALLERAKRHAHVAIITGRAVADGARMVNVDGLTYIGTHGLEWSDGLPSRTPVQLLPEAMKYVEAGRYLLDLAEKEQMPGIFVERKSVGGAIHYRLAPNPEQARQSIQDLLEEPAQQVHMKLSEGKRVIEVRVPLHVNKGQALRSFAQRYQLQGILFAGDDRTDIDALKEVELLRSEGVRALGVAVQHSDTLDELLAHADIVVHEVAGMAELLRRIVAELEELDQQGHS